MNDTVNDAGLSHCCTAISGDKPDNQERCPMAAVFLRFGSGRKSGWLFLLPGVLLVLTGVSILIVPQVLVWLIGGLTILFGLMMLSAAFMLRGNIDLGFDP